MALSNIDQAKHLWQLTFEGDWPTAVAFLGSSDRLAAANRAGQIFLWDLSVDPAEQKGAGKNEKGKNEKGKNEKGKNEKDEAAPPSLWPVRQFTGHENGVSRLAVTADGKLLVSASLDHTVRLWNPSSPAAGRAEVVLDQQQREQAAKRARDDEPLQAPGIEVETVEPIHVLREHRDWVEALGLSGDGSRMITGDARCHTIIWDLAKPAPLRRWDGYPTNGITSAALSPRGALAFNAEYCSRRGDFDRPPAQAKFYDANSGEMRTDLLAVQFPDVKERDNSYGYATKWGKFVARGLVCADFSPDGKLLAVGQGGETGTGQVHLIEVPSGKLVRSVSGHRYGVCDVRFTADGKHVISSGRDTMVRICKVEDGKEVGTLGKSRGGQFKDWLTSISISPDERRIAAADIAGLVHVWELPE